MEPSLKRKPTFEIDYLPSKIINADAKYKELYREVIFKSKEKDESTVMTLTERTSGKWKGRYMQMRRYFNGMATKCGVTFDTDDLVWLRDNLKRRQSNENDKYKVDVSDKCVKIEQKEKSKFHMPLVMLPSFFRAANVLIFISECKADGEFSVKPNDMLALLMKYEFRNDIQLTDEEIKNFKPNEIEKFKSVRLDKQLDKLLSDVSFLTKAEALLTLFAFGKDDTVRYLTHAFLHRTFYFDAAKYFFSQAKLETPTDKMLAYLTSKN